MRVLARLLAVALLALAGAAHAEETIRSYASAIAIQSDGSLLVAETLRVNAEGEKIKRGIFRDFPTRYRDRNGQNVVIGFEVLGVQRDGSDEPWFTEPLENGVRIYVGNRDRMLDAGEHEYVLRYRTTRQLGFFPEHDELYWNVTGNGWDFPIEQSSADVTLPTSVPADRLRIEGWTGPQGSTERSVRASVRDGGASLAATRALAPKHGLTIAFTFPKGVIAAPDTAQKLRWWAHDNRGMLVALGGFLLLWTWYGWRWLRYGRDPAPGVVMPEYEAPQGLSPSLLRYVRRMAYDEPAFVSDLLHMAQRGFLRIEKKGKKYELDKLQDAKEERSPIGIALQLMFAKRKSIALDSEAHSLIGPARAMHKEKVLEFNRHGAWFHRNTWSTVIGMVASALIIVAALLMQGGQAGIGGLFASVFLAVMATVVVWNLLGLMRDKRGRFRRAFMLVIGLIGCAMTGLLLVLTAGTVMFALIAAFALTNAAFAALMPAYTPAGRKLVDRIEGFAQYLSVAEKDDLAREKAPPMSGERFAAFLPYAQALDVEEAWTDKFAAAVGVAAAAEAMRVAVSPWYHGDRAFSTSSFSSDVGRSLSSAISSASTPPGTSSGGGYSGGGYSGGGGGGSSGGGGGGGGGGGW